MKKRTTTIHHPSDLNSLNSFSFARRRGLGTIKLSDDFQHEEKEMLEMELNKNYYACGCTSSSKLLIGGLLIGAALTLTNGSFYEISLPHPAVTILGLGVVGAVIGKVSGLTKANFKLKRTIHTIQAFWRPKQDSNEGGFVCG